MTEAEKAYQYFVIAVPENEEQAKAYFWARKALQSTLTRPNEPLTLEELREMSGKPFYDCASREWYIVDYVLGSVLYTEESVYFNFAEEETTDRFYRRPPEGEA